MSCSWLRGPYARSAVTRSFLLPAWCEVFLGLGGRTGRVVGGAGVGDVAQWCGVAVHESGGEEKLLVHVVGGDGRDVHAGSPDGVCSGLDVHGWLVDDGW